MSEIVWLTEERCFAYLISLGAHVSRVQFKKLGIDYDIYIENDEWEPWEPFEREG